MEIGQVEPAMQGRQRRSPDFPQQRELKEVDVEMQYVERRCPLPDLLEQAQMIGNGIEGPGVESQRRRRAGD